MNEEKTKQFTDIAGKIGDDLYKVIEKYDMYSGNIIFGATLSLMIVIAKMNKIPKNIVEKAIDEMFKNYTDL